MSHAETPHPPAQAPFIVRMPGAIVRRILRWGMPLGPNGVLDITGRKTGLPRPQPLAVAAYQERRYVVGAYGDVNWCRNLRATPEAELHMGRSSESVVAVELTGPDAVAFYSETLPAYVAELPTLWRIGVRNFIGSAAPQIFTDPVEAARRHPVFELIPR